MAKDHADKSKARRRNRQKRHRRTVLRFCDWELYEADARLRTTVEPTPLAYVREWINDDKRNPPRITRKLLSGSPGDSVL